MRSEQWIRTQKRRVRKKYRKVGNMYFSPKEFRDFRHGKYLNVSILNKALKRITKGVQELADSFRDAAKVISEAYKEESDEQ